MLTLEERALSKTLQLMKHEPQPILWKAIAAFLQICVRKHDGSADADADADEAGGAPAGPSIASGGAARLAKSPLVQLANLIGLTPSTFTFGVDASPLP